MQNVNFEQVIEQIVAADPRYQPEAYGFLREALDFTQRQVAPSGQDRPRHVTGQQLLDGIRQFALREFGPMAATVLAAWGITRCEDFGEIVFNLVDHRFLSRNDTDRREDFHGGYDFEEAFVRPFLPPSRRPPGRTALEPRPEGAA